VFTQAGSPTSASGLQSRGVEVISDELELVHVLDELGKRSIQSLLVEGGSTLAGFLVDARLINKFTFFIAPMIIGGDDAPSAIGGAGAEKIAEALQLENTHVQQRGRDIEVTGYPESKDEG